MKIKFLILSIVAIFTLGAKAQLIVNSGQSANNQEAKEGAAKLLNTFVEAIKSNTWLNTYSKQKSSFLNTTENVSDATGMAVNISLLATFIKPDKFKNGVTKNSVMSAASAVNSIGDAKNLLRNFETWLKPDAINPMWKLQRNAWINEIELVK